MFPSGYLEGALIFAGVAAASLLFTALAGWRERRRENRRTMAVQALATGLGLDFSAAPPPGFALPGVQLVRRADLGARAMNFLLPRGQGRSPLLFCDLKLQSRGGKGTCTAYATVALADPGRELPVFELRPEGLLDKADQLLGTPDLDLDWAPGFSSKYVLTGRDESALREFFTPERVAVLERRPGFCLQGAGRGLLIARGACGPGELSPAAYPAFLEEAGALLAELAP